MTARHLITSLSIFCVTVLLASPQPAVAQQAAVWLYVFHIPPATTGLPWAMGVAQQVASPSSVILGHLPQAGAAGEVAVSQAIISVGDQVPLPTYADGSQAKDAEVFWTVQLWHAEFFTDGVIRYREGDHVVATFNGRQFVSAEAQINTGGAVPPPTNNFQVLVNVVGVRSATTPARRETMGSIKTRYR